MSHDINECYIIKVNLVNIDYFLLWFYNMEWQIRLFCFEDKICVWHEYEEVLNWMKDQNLKLEDNELSVFDFSNACLNDHHYFSSKIDVNYFLNLWDICIDLTEPLNTSKCLLMKKVLRKNEVLRTKLFYCSGSIVFKNKCKNFRDVLTKRDLKY